MPRLGVRRQGALARAFQLRLFSDTGANLTGNRMPSDPQNPEILTTAPSDIEAATIVGALEVHGISAITTGGFIAGFRAEAPAVVNIVVRHEDLERARAVLAQINAACNDIDWPNIDVGEADESE